MAIQTQADTESTAATARPRPKWVLALALTVALLAATLTVSYGFRQHWNLMPDYAQGWHLGSTLTPRQGIQCVSSAAERYPGMVDRSSAIGRSPQAWAFMAGCFDARDGYQDMRWQLQDRKHSGPRGMPDD
jgi:hypothetical protein